MLADFRHRPLSRTAAVAITASVGALDLNLFITSKSRFLKAERERCANALPLTGSIGTRAAAKPAAEETLEDAAEVNVPKTAKAASSGARPIVGIDSGVAVLVVERLLLAVAQDFVGFVSFLKTLLLLFIPRVQIGMAFPRRLTVRFFNLVLIGGARDAQYVVIIALVVGHMSLYLGNVPAKCGDIGLFVFVDNLKVGVHYVVSAGRASVGRRVAVAVLMLLRVQLLADGIEGFRQRFGLLADVGGVLTF